MGNLKQGAELSMKSSEVRQRTKAKDTLVAGLWTQADERLAIVVASIKTAKRR
jgi:hypothetical protein